MAPTPLAWSTVVNSMKKNRSNYIMIGGAVAAAAAAITIPGTMRLNLKNPVPVTCIVIIEDVATTATKYFALGTVAGTPDIVDAAPGAGQFCITNATTVTFTAGVPAANAHYLMMADIL